MLTRFSFESDAWTLSSAPWLATVLWREIVLLLSCLSFTVAFDLFRKHLLEPSKAETNFQFNPEFNLLSLATFSYFSMASRTLQSILKPCSRRSFLNHRRRFYETRCTGLCLVYTNGQRNPVIIRLRADILRVIFLNAGFKQHILSLKTIVPQDENNIKYPFHRKGLQSWHNLTRHESKARKIIVWVRILRFRHTLVLVVFWIVCDSCIRFWTWTRTQAQKDWLNLNGLTIPKAKAIRKCRWSPQNCIILYMYWRFKLRMKYVGRAEKVSG